MIRKFGFIDVDPQDARRIAVAADSWPDWMPSIRATRILESSPQRILVEVHRAQGRRVHKTRLELLPHRFGYFERQVTGPARRWELDWQFRSAPDKEGTVVSCRFDVDLGFFGLFVPKRMVQRAVDHTFDKILQGLETECTKGSEQVPPREDGVSPFADVRQIRISATESDLEIWIGDRRYIAERVVD